MSKPVVHALIPAAGQGQRFGGATLKQYLPIAGKPVLAHAIDAVNLYPQVSGITVIVAADDNMFDTLIDPDRSGVNTVVGGDSRAQSVLNGLQSICMEHPQTQWVLVHDAARPCVPAWCLEDLLEKGLCEADGAILAVPVRDTLKRTDAGGHITETVDRRQLWAAQTPQLFPIDRLRSALEAMLGEGESPTDEAEAMENSGAHPLLVMGSPANIKITWPEDMAVAEAWFAAKALAETGSGEGIGENMEDIAKDRKFRVGQGFDVHAFGAGDHVILCGERISHPFGLDAHSDGDVALHALCDALLGAAALGDIGRHFPPGDAEYENADSRGLTRAVIKLLAGQGWRVNNADITLICEAPRIGPHVNAMIENVASDLGLENSCISIKATTTESLGFCGRKEGIAAMAIVSLVCDQAC